MTDNALASLRRSRPWAAPITENERAWIELIRLSSYDTDPAPTLETVQEVRQVFMPRVPKRARGGE